MNLQKVSKNIVNLINSKKFDEAIKECIKIIDLKIENTQIYNFYGLALQKKALFKNSIKYFSKSIQLNKNNFIAINNLAVTYKALGQLKLSEKKYKECLELNPDYIIGLLNFANLKQDINKFNDSIELFHRARKLSRGKNDIYIFSKLCNLYQIIGDTKEAKKYAEQIININHSIPLGYILVSKFTDHKNNLNYINKMEDFLKSKKISKNDEIDLLFTLGKAYESIKKYKIAFEYYNKGNNLRKKLINFEPSTFIKLHKSIIKYFKNFNFDKNKKNNFKKKIIFICGMPRSGSSLVEHIISSHKKVTATGENIFFSNTIKSNFLKNFELIETRINEDLIKKNNFFQEALIDFLDQNNYQGDIITDKTVQNFLWVGFIKAYFPNSKIIFTERNPKDISLSIFKTDFVDGFMNFAYSENDIVEFYKLYVELEKFWKKIFKDEIYTINYESLIQNSTQEIKRLIKYCELDWDDNCLKHYNNKSPVNTASVNQVRKPIYNSSINLYDKYSQFFDGEFKNLTED